jgi:hypothetical protein
MILFAKHHTSDPDHCPLQFVFKLLNAPGVNASVSSLIVNMVDSLITSCDESEADPGVKVVPVNQLMDLSPLHGTEQTGE